MIIDVDRVIETGTRPEWTKLGSYMADDDVTYMTKTVRSIRGLESRTAAKWEKEGWEIVSQSPGKVQTEIVLRRPALKTPWRLYSIGGGVVAVVIIALIVNGIIRERSSSESTRTSADAASEVTPTPREAASPQPTPSTSATVEQPVLTPDNNAEFAAILGVGDGCDESVAPFAEKYRGRTIAFDGSVAAMSRYDGTRNLYDILIGAGDSGANYTRGPAFQFRNVNTTSDLHYTGDTAGTLSVNTKLRIAAQVIEYKQISCLFFLKPVETTFR